MCQVCENLVERDGGRTRQLINDLGAEKANALVMDSDVHRDSEAME